MTGPETNRRSAFCAIVGRPNVGKSSILNALLGQKVSIVSSKPQTTRTRIMGVYTQGEDQLVFLDTPGLLRPRDRLGDYMKKAVSETVNGVDFCLLVVEAGTKISPADRELIERFQSQHIPAVLAINKIDLLQDKTRLMEQIAGLSGLFPFEAVVPVSARDGSGMEELRKELRRQCMPGDHFFDEDTLTDQPERVLAAEIVREKLLRLLDKEVPHGVAVVTERMREREDQPGITDIDATIYCERDSHKAIIIGKGGSMLKRVGTYARQDLEKFFGCRVNLQLWVKVKEDWRNRQNLLHDFGFDAKDFNN